jgi:predicted nucleic acid-binding protein
VIVLDASALVDIVADRPARDAVLDRLGEPITAPGHQLAEVSSAVARLVRAGELTPERAAGALADAARLGQDVVPVDEGLLLRAFALRASVRILDGLYVALAERNQCPLVTTDGRLARSEPPCEVVYVGGD